MGSVGGSTAESMSGSMKGRIRRGPGSMAGGVGMGPESMGRGTRVYPGSMSEGTGRPRPGLGDAGGFGGTGGFGAMDAGSRGGGGNRMDPERMGGSEIQSATMAQDMESRPSEMGGQSIPRWGGGSL
jgi:hypothetical protein